MMFSTQMLKDALGLQMMFSIQMFKDALEQMRKKFKQTTCNKAMLQKNKYDSTTKHISFNGAMKETFEY